MRWLAWLVAAVTAFSCARADTPPDYLSLAALRTQYGEVNAKIAVIQGVEVYYIDEGAGPVIVLLHGSNSTLRTYDQSAKILRRHFRVIRFDQPPYGLSGAVTSELLATPLYPVDILDGLLDQLHVDHATFAGVSSGGALAFYYAGRHPDRVDRLILSNTPADPVDNASVKESPALRAVQAAQGPTKIKSQAFWRAYFDFYTGDPERIGAKLIEEYYDINRRAPERNPLAINTALNDSKLTQATLAGITAPTLLVWGARDPLLTPPTATTLAQYLKNTAVSTVILPDVSHYPPLEVPERFAAIVESYIEAVPPAH